LTTMSKRLVDRSGRERPVTGLAGNLSSTVRHPDRDPPDPM
jgi:hypothetical protein